MGWGFGAQWPEPIAILPMMVFTVIGAAAACRTGGHIAVSMFTNVLPALSLWLPRAMGLWPACG